MVVKKENAVPGKYARPQGRPAPDSALADNPDRRESQTARDTPAILVVDDTPTSLDLVRSVLEAEGFRTLTAGDGPTARHLARGHQPDLILLDVMLPGETGFETCSQLKSDPVTADIPIIFLSALDDVKSKVAGLKIGGVDYIAKPVHGEEVLARVRVHLRIRQTNRALVGQPKRHLRSVFYQARNCR
jgi:sigma-B regulation protein RsbU (phosphoserine phosphatase)